MANVENIESQQKWYCHTCEREVVPDLTEFSCGVCGGGFIEKLEASDSSNDTASSNSSQNADTQHTEPQTVPPNHTQQQNGGNILRVNFGPMFGNRRHPAPYIQPTFDSFQGFVGHLLSGLFGDLNNLPATLNIEMGPQILNGNIGDYIFSTEAHDNFITLLLNQLEGTGPPPAAKEHIDTLPVTIITQGQVDDRLQCHICMENFQLEEKVKELPCRHVYHGECIVPWLELHGTCPVCRKRIDADNESSGDHTLNLD